MPRTNRIGAAVALIQVNADAALNLAPYIKMAVFGRWGGNA
jgi:hypothetical protein